jgi:hypothetical protein
MDEIDMQILKILQDDGRALHEEIGRRLLDQFVPQDGLFRSGDTAQCEVDLGTRGAI